MIFWRSVHQQLITFCWWSRLRCGTGIFKRNFHCASACKARYRITNSASLSVRQCILSKTMDSGTWSYFWRSGRGILLVFDPYCRYKIPKGTLSGSIKLYRGGKLNYYGTLIGSSWSTDTPMTLSDIDRGQNFLADFPNYAQTVWQWPIDDNWYDNTWGQ